VSPGTAWGAYAKITDILRERFTAQEPGSLLPSEASLCAEFAVVRNTIRRALATLEHEGLIKTLPGKGWHLRADGTSAQYHYRRIATDLRTQINNGGLKPGDALPSEATITKTYGVARGTARAAFALLQSEGLTETHHGKGRFVRM
jgi:DNA-binding GntR family transcriptional regulator